MRRQQFLTLAIMSGFLVGALAACGGTSGSKNSGKIEDKIKSGKVLATQDGVEIHEGYVDLLKQVNPNIEGQLQNPAGKKRLVDNLLEQEVLYREALKQGLPQNPKYQEKAALYERVIFAQGVLEEAIDKKAREYYNSNKEKEFSEVGVSHILIRTEAPRPNAKDEASKKGVSEAEALEKAKAAKKKLDEGAAWEEVVMEFSDDRLTKNKSGDLGKISKEDRRASRLEWQALIDQAFKMKKDEISEPIKAKDGYHIIKVTEVAGVAPYEEVETRIKFKMRGTVKKEVLEELADEKIEYQDEELKNLATPKPGMPGAGSITPHVQPAAKPMPKPAEKQEPKDSKN